jgi:hypothetical protein
MRTSVVERFELLDYFADRGFKMPNVGSKRTVYQACFDDLAHVDPVADVETAVEIKTVETAAEAVSEVSEVHTTADVEIAAEIKTVSKPEIAKTTPQHI